MKPEKSFDKVIVIGGTGLLFQVVDVINEYEVAPKVEVYECNSNGLKKKRDSSYEYYKVDNKKELMEVLQKEESKALVLSVMNPYIITEAVVLKENLLVVNVHHALLPKHRGRNAEAWAIYEGDSEAGITWHRINAGVDTGDIYIQKSVPIDDKMTSIKLLTKLNEVAVSGLQEILTSGFETLTPVKQRQNIEGQLHLNKDVPNNGYLDLSWSVGQMSYFLRAMDYGILYVLGKPKVRWNEEDYVFSSYRIIACQQEIMDSVMMDPETKSMKIIKDGVEITLNKMKRMERR